MRGERALFGHRHGGVQYACRQHRLPPTDVEVEAAFLYLDGRVPEGVLTFLHHDTMILRRDHHRDLRHRVKTEHERARRTQINRDPKATEGWGHVQRCGVWVCVEGVRTVTLPPEGMVARAKSARRMRGDFTWVFGVVT